MKSFFDPFQDSQMRRFPRRGTAMPVSKTSRVAPLSRPWGSGQPARDARRRRRALPMVAFAALLLPLFFVTARAGTPAGYAEYIVPFDEDVFAYVTDFVTTGAIAANDTTFSLISVTAWSDTVTVYLDHWENGYNLDPANPDATADEKYVVNKSQTLNFQSLAIPRPRTGPDGNTYIGVAGNCVAQPTPAVPVIHNTLNFCYDGRDRIISVGGATTVTRGGYLNTAGLGKLAAIGEEVYPLAPQLIKYVLPFGDDPTRLDFQRVAALVQATEDNTTLQIDFNADGVFDAFNTENGYRTARADPVDSTTITLQRGQTYILDTDSNGIAGAGLPRGAVILGDKTLQVEYFYGEVDSAYNTRAVSAFPRGFWSTEYYASADSGTVTGTDILLYNPNNAPITINWETTTSTGSFTLLANETGFFQAKTGAFVPDGSGVYLKGTAPFWGTSDVDSNNANYDWGYSLIPSYLVSDDQTVAWAPGNSPALACDDFDGRGNGLFVSPVLDNTTFFIDANGDGVPDTNASIEVLRGGTTVAATGSGYLANRLDSLYITGSNSGTTAGSLCDLTGARIFATGPFSMSYGENPDKTGVGDGLDLGYTVLPSPANWMDLALTVDKSTTPALVSTVAGATTVTFTLVVNSHEFNIDSLSVVDTLPANWAYDPGSALITLPNLTTVSANPAGAPGPTLTWGSGVLGSLLPNQQITITFTARTTAAFANGAITLNDVQAVGTRTVGGVLQTFKATDFVFNTFTDGTVGMAVTKTSSVPAGTPVSPGDTLTYTLTMSNPPPATTTLTGVSIFDPLPPGVTYVGGSGSITCELPASTRNVLDQFNTNGSYAGNNGSHNWAAGWTETDAQGAAPGPTAGFVLVAANHLRFRYQTSSVSDNFNQASYTFQGGTNSWTSDWTETGDDGSPTTGVITADGGTNRLNFGPGATGKSISRTAAVSGNSATITFALSDQGVDAGEGVIAEYRLNAGPFIEIQRIDNNTLTTTTAMPISVAGASTITLRFTSFDTGNGTFEAGDVAGVDNPLIVFNDAVGASAQRTVNLTNATSAALTFTVPVTANLEATDTLVVEASASPAGPFTTLATYTGNTTTGVQPYNLTPYISATTTIRFRVTSEYNATNESFDIDNVDITYNIPAGVATFASTPPPELLASAAGCRIQPGNSMTATFSVTVDNPFPANQSEILNTATVGAAQIPVPLTASALNIVLVPGGGTATVGDRVWLDLDGDGIFDPGETGIAGVEVTLKDQFGTPLQAITTDSQGRYTFVDIPPGTGYYVEITGGLPAGLTQTTETVGDAFNLNGVFTGNDGTLNWLTNWTETGDDGSATTGDIRVANNRIEFRDTAATVAANESIQRSVTVTGATSIEVQYAWAGPTAGATALVAGSDRVVVEYSTDGAVWTTLRTINADAAQTFTDIVAWTPSNNTFFVRYRTLDVLETNKLAAIDNVQVRFPQNLRTANFNLVAGQDYLQADLGYRASAGTAAIGDLVWVDADNDRFRDPGEVGLAGITVQLFQDTNGDGTPDGPAIASTVTGPGGAYLFTGLVANGINDYVVTLSTGQAALTGYTATTATLFYFPNLASGSVRVDADFGFQNPTGTFTITDGVWLDNGLPSGTANDGIKNGTEAGIAGVTVDLLDSAGNIIATTTTTSAGTFQFTGVPGGQNYRWRITDTAAVIADFFGTTTSALSGEFQMTGPLTSNLDFTASPHFGYNQTRSIGDTVWNDNGAGGGTLGNGIQDGTEPGIGGVNVLLYRDVNNNGIFEPGGADGSAFATQVTDPFGHYLFAGLPTGNRWFVSIDNNQSALSGFNVLTTAADFDGIPGNGQQRQVTPALTGTANRLDIDYGYRTTTPFALSGRFFSDANRSGADEGEPGFGGVTLELVNGQGIVVGATTTAVDGSYSFLGLPAGTYVVRVTDTSGILTGGETTFERTELGLAAAYNGQETITLGPSVANANFGFFRGNALVTRAVISSFRARDIGGSVALEWTTASEVGTVGFHLMRWNREEKRYAAVNRTLIPSLIASPQGGSYHYVDPEAQPGESYRYLIVEVEATGNRLRYGPFEVNTRATSESEADLGKDANRHDADTTLLEQGSSRSAHREGAERRRRRAQGAAADQERAVSRRRAASAKIGVPDTGLYYLSLESLRSLEGVRVPRNWLSSYSLSNRGEPVAFAVSPDRDGILFYGRGTVSNVERDNVYQLSNSGSGLWMKTRGNAAAPPPSGDEVFIKSQHVEKDVFSANNVFHDPEGDFWVWDYVFAGFGAKPFSFRADGVTGRGAASMVIRLKGGTDTTAIPDHHASFLLNGSPIGEAHFEGLDASESALEFDSSLLVDGENTLTIDGLTDTEAPFSLFYVDSFDLRYESRYRAHDNKVEVPASGHASILISGFTRPHVAVFDISAPEQPVVVTAPVRLLPDGTWGVTVASRNRQATYYAVTPDGLSRPSRILPDTPSALRRASNEGEYLIITTEGLKETAQTLADYRSDLRSQVIDIEDVYDEFNFGNANPNALRDFLNYAKTRWRTPPRYVVLAGDGTDDYKNILGLDDNLIPPMMADTPSGLSPSDPWFVARPGRTTSPEIAIGRLPVTTSAELTEVIRKIRAREHAVDLNEPWVRSTLLVADNPDAAGNFLSSSETVGALLPASDPVGRAYISSLGGAQTRNLLIDSLNQGTGVISYFGHAGFDRLADESILTSADAATLENTERPALLTTMTCLAGDSALSGYTTISETLLRDDGGGVVAFWGPTGMSENALAGPLAEGFYAALYRAGPRRLGDAVTDARRSYSASRLPAYMLSIYNLLGDPATRVR